MAGKQGRPGEKRETRRVNLLRPEYQRLLARVERGVSDVGLSQRALSRKMSMDPTFVNQVLTGKRSLDFIEFLDLSSATEVDPRDLLSASLDDSDNPTPQDESRSCDTTS